MFGKGLAGDVFGELFEIVGPAPMMDVLFQPVADEGEFSRFESSSKTWKTSMEIGVKVIAEDFRTLEQKDILSVYFIFVAMDDENKPVEIISVIPEIEEQIASFKAAEKRRQHRLAYNK